MKLTGFKHKKSIREARNELVSLGLISITRGNGRLNTYYSFRFDWVGDTLVPPSGISMSSPGEHGGLSLGVVAGAPGALPQSPPHNQIHISITNNVQTQLPEELSNLIKRFGDMKVRRAVTECDLAGMDVTPANVESILSAKLKRWLALREQLGETISPESLRAMESSLIAEAGDVLVFQSELAPHLKKILTRHGGRVEFVHSSEKPAAQ